MIYRDHCAKKNVLKTKWIFILVALFFAANSAQAQSRGQIITPAAPAKNPMNPNGDTWVTKETTPGFAEAFSPYSPTGYYVNEFELKMFGLPIVGKGDIAGDNQTGPECGMSDLIPDTKGFPVYGALVPFTYPLQTQAINNLVFRYRLGDNASSVNSWSVLIDVDNRFGLGNDPNATAANPGFELEITLINKTNPGVFITNVDGISSCPTPFKSYLLENNFQIAVGDMRSCNDPDYFFDFFVTVPDLLAAYNAGKPLNQQVASTDGFRFVAATSNSSTCFFGGSNADVGGVNDDVAPYAGNIIKALTDVVNNQCPTAIESLCQDSSCEGFNTGYSWKPTINPIAVGDTRISGTTKLATYVKVSVFSLLSPDVYSTTPKAPAQTVFSSDGTWSVTLTLPLQNNDKVVAQSQTSADGSSICDGLSSNSSTSTTIVNNFRPVATPQSLTTPEDTRLSPITLTGTDANATDVLTFSVATQPTNGTLTGSGATYSYTPNPNFFGTDSFTFTASDGKAVSLPATISITVTAVNDAPVAKSRSVTTLEDTPVTIALWASDVEKDSTLLTFASTVPLNGILSCYTCKNPIYTPKLNFTGSDSFTFTASDGTATSTSATVSITVTQVNDAPIAKSRTVITNEDTPLQITLWATDAESDSISLQFVNAIPTNGTLSCYDCKNPTYTPNPNFNGTDSFSFTASDGSATSSPATVTISVTPVNDIPVAKSRSVTTEEDTPLSITLWARDVEKDSTSLTFVSTKPPHGDLSCYDCKNPTYTPNLNYNGPDSFTFTANDGTAPSTAATVSITVTPVNDAPVAANQAVSTTEDVSVSFTLTGGSDVDGDQLTYSVVLGPTKGTLSGTAPNLTYKPNANYNGSDSFTYKVNDGKEDSNVATVTITITAVNDAPEASDQSVTTNEDTAKAITLVATDVDVPTTLTYTIVAGSGPTHGTLSGTAPNLTYTPNANYNGPDSFTFRASDGTAISNTATVSITVSPVNDAPVANSQSVSVNEDASVLITLTGSDIDRDPLTYIIVINPTHGTVTDPGLGATVTYTPAANYSGPDSFTFKVNDGTTDSSTPATVTITVNPLNDAPEALDKTVPYLQNTPVSFTLEAIDPDPTDNITYTVLTQPANGTLTGTPPNLTFTPALNFAGTTTFTFRVSDGTVPSNTATVTLTLDDLQEYAPIAFDQAVSVDEDNNLNILLRASDADADPLTYVIVSGPTHGSITIGTGNTRVYTPALNYTGTDSFTFKANDGDQDSNEATVTITVNPINDAPTANPQTVLVTEDVAKAITLTGSDVENSPLTYTVINAPAHGTLSGTGANLTYTPNLNYNGSDNFTFKVNDGSLDSTPATVSISVQAVNDKPVATAQTVTTAEDTPLAIVLSGSDVDGNALTYTITTQPAHGTLSGTAPNITYSPASNYNGPDSFAFTVNDGTIDSNPATISITVTPVNDVPVANAQSVTVVEDTPKAITLTGSDVEGSTLTFTIVALPARGTLSGSGANIIYTPNANFFGSDSFTFKVNDGTVDSNIATVSITVTSDNDLPVAVNDNATTNEDNAVTFSLTQNDTDLDGVINVATVDLDPSTPAEEKSRTTTEGVFTVNNLGAVTFTPVANFNGTSTITYTVKDNDGDVSNAAQIVVTVLPVNDAPVVTPKTVDVLEDVPTSICFLFTDIENDPAVFSTPDELSLNGKGSVKIDPLTGAFCFIYTPNEDFNGPDGVRVTICDALNPTLCNTGLITINVVPVNDAPRLIVDNKPVTKVDYTTPEDTPLSRCFTMIDPDGDAITISNLTNVTGGGTMNISTGTGNERCFDFAPALNFNGLSTWTFKACDNANPSLCNTFTLNINVTPVNDTPVANAQTVTTVEEIPKAITLTGSDVDGDALTYIIVDAPLHGTLSGSGANITYTPANDFSGDDRFTFKVNDGSIDSDAATVNITVNPVNDAPFILPLPAFQTPEDTPLRICLSPIDPDGDVLTFSNPINLEGGGTMTAEGNGICFLFTPAKDFNGTATWKFKVCDTGNPALCTETTVTIKVTPVNDPPVAVNDNLTVKGPVLSDVINLIENDTDVDGDQLALTILPVAGPFHGTIVTMNSNGKFEYIANLGFVGSDSVRYKVCDSANPSLCDEGVVFIKVEYPPFKIYNAISPNGDSLNDYWRIDGIEAYPNNQVKIFDRYNNLIFEMKGYNNEGNSWTGQINHSLIKGTATDGTYYYIVDLGDGTALINGYLVLKNEQ